MQFVFRKELVLKGKGSMNPVPFWLKETWAMRPEKKSLSGFWVGLWLVAPGKLRVSVGVDCFVPCPPSVAPRRL